MFTTFGERQPSSISAKMTSSLDLPTIPEWFRGSRVLITGGSGFMGKVLVEKLLRSCPEVDTIYLLLRPKKGKQPSSRIQDITDQPLFDKLRKEFPESFNKLVAVSGDVKELGLGLSDADRCLLQQQVDVVFHSAASVRFDDPIRDAVLINVRGTREVLNLALGMDKLKVLLHVSTTYCNRDTPKVLEKLYPAPADWRTMISLVEESDKDDTMLRCLTPKILADAPNTYTFAKALGEQVINDYKDKLPLVIVRPSIVTSTVDEPIPGWIDNFNGPVGLMMGGAAGVLRTVYADKNNYGDYVPVDVAIKSIIFIAWHSALLSDANSLPIYNCSSMIVPKTLGQVMDVGRVILSDIPLTNSLWHPTSNEYTTNRWIYYINVMLFHLLPALIVDQLFKLSGRKPMLANIQRRIYNANMALSVYMTNNFYFSNTNFLQLQTSHMKPTDVAAFSYNTQIPDMLPYFRKCLFGARVYLLKDPPSTLPMAKIRYNRMYWLDRVAKTLFNVGCLWIVWTITLTFYQNTLHPVLDSLLNIDLQ